MINQQKILFIANDLHKRGYENLHIVPGISPNGMAWRCTFAVIINNEKQDIVVSNWIGQFCNDFEEEVKISIDELSKIFEKEHLEFLDKCKTKNNAYVKWFSAMLISLQEGELPYAYSDYFSADEHWKTSKEREIKCFSGEKIYWRGC